jgi:hypothetical protein
MFTVREALIADASSLKVLEDTAFESLSNFRGLAQFLEMSPRIGDEWNDLVNDAKYRLLVGLSEGVIHGYLLVEIFKPLHKALIKQVFVDSSARQRCSSSTAKKLHENRDAQCWRDWHYPETEI